MRKEIFFIIGIIFLSLILIVMFFYFNTHFSPSAPNLEKCNIIKEGSDEAISLVFFSDNVEDVENYVNYFLDAMPFREYKDKFNFYYVGNYKPGCELYKGIALLCYSRELIQKAASCPIDHIVVLNNDFEKEIRSSTYLNVMSINTKHPLSVFLHEFGHSFVNLAEEYVPAKVPRNSAGNCAEKCDDFTGRNDGCYEGCSERNYFRSIEEGVMRTLRKSDYGSYNNFVLVNRINEITEGRNPLISGMATQESQNCAKEKYWLIEGYKINDEFKISKSVQRGCAGRGGEGEYSYDVVFKDGSEFELGGFSPDEIFTEAPIYVENEEGIEEIGDGIDGEIFSNIELIYTDAPGEDEEIEGEIIERSVVDFHLTVPVTEEASDLKVKDENKNVVFETGVSIEEADRIFSSPTPSASPTGSPSTPQTSPSSSVSPSATSSGSASPSGTFTSPTRTPGSPTGSSTPQGSSTPLNDKGYFGKFKWLGRTITGWVSKIF